MSRWKAASLHLGVNFALISLIASLVVALWYPPALLPMSGMIGLLGLIALISTGAGPLLTLAVYRQGKHHLWLDLSVIAALHLTALSGGLYVLAQHRPVFMVATIDRLELVRAGELAAEELVQAPPSHQRLPWTGPKWVGVRRPDDHADRLDVLFSNLDGRDLQHQPRRYLDFALTAPDLMESAQPLSDLLPLLDTRERNRLDRAIDESDIQRTRYLAINSLSGAAMILVDSQNRLGNMVAIDPFDALARGKD